MNNLSSVLGGFDANEVEISSGFEPIPEGEYCAVISAVELKTTSKGGDMLEFDFTVQGSTHDGRVLKDRLNIVNANEVAERIGKENLAKICLAINLATPKDTNEFIGKRLKIKVTVKAGQGTYINKFGEEKPSQPQNEIKGYFPLNSAPAQVEQSPVQQEQVVQEAPQEAQAQARPWA